MITIDAADVVPMNQFPLAWRFTDERWSRRGGEALRDVRPLTPARAAGLHGPLTAACVVAREAGARHVPAACQDEAGAREVGAALRALTPADDERIAIVWDHAHRPRDVLADLPRALGGLLLPGDGRRHHQPARRELGALLPPLGRVLVHAAAGGAALTSSASIRRDRLPVG